MKKSIKRQMAMMFAGLTIGILVMIFVINACFLQPFYVHNKQKAFVEMYQSM